MEPAHERTLRRMTRQLAKDPRGAFVIASCADLELREEIERRLSEALAPERSLEVLEWEEHPASPWDEILGAAKVREGVVVSVHYDAIEPPSLEDEPADAAGVGDGDGNALLRLNIGRDIRTREQIPVVLWVRGPGPIEVLRGRTPDLWAHRTLVARFPSRGDFAVRWGQHETVDLEKEVQKLLEDANAPWGGPEQGIYALSDAALYLFEMGRIKECERIVERMKSLYISNPSLHENDHATWSVAVRQLMLAAMRSDWCYIDRRTEELASLARERDWPKVAGLALESKANVSRERGFAANELDFLSDWMSLVEKDPYARNCRATARTRLGDPLRAVSDLDAVSTESLHTLAAANRGRIVSRVARVRAHIAKALGRPDEALRWAWISTRRSEHMQLWSSLEVVLHLVHEIYLEQGLPELAQAEDVDMLGKADSAGFKTVLCNTHDHATALALARGDRNASMGHARAYLSLRSTLNLTTANRTLLDCSELARSVYPSFSDPTELHTWPTQIDEHLEHETNPDPTDRLTLERARWHLLTNEPESAARLADSTLPFRRAERGPSFIAASCTVAAQAHRELGRFDLARERLAEARDVLLQTREDARPFDSYKEVMLERARLATAEHDPDAAWQAITDALDFATQRHIKIEQMRLHLELARLEPGSARGRDAAQTSLRIANELGYLRDEGQIRLELAKQARLTGDLDRARSELAEARWLLDQLGPPERRDEAHALADALD